MKIKKAIIKNMFEHCSLVCVCVCVSCLSETMSCQLPRPLCEKQVNNYYGIWLIKSIINNHSISFLMVFLLCIKSYII